MVQLYQDEQMFVKVKKPGNLDLFVWVCYDGRNW